MKLHIPQVKCKDDQPITPLWMTREAKKLIKKKFNSYIKQRENPTHYNHFKYTQTRNESTRVNRAAIRVFEKKIADNCKDNPRSFWKYVGTKTKAKSGISALMTGDGEMLESDKDKAELLNKFFSSVFTREDKQNVPHVTESSKSDGKAIKDLNKITPDIVEKKLKELNANKAQGPDKIPPRVLKELAKELSTPLCALFNKSIKSSTLPNDWKNAAVTAIFKKGTKSDPGNYRPVSLTCVTCKILESCVRDQIVSYFMENNLYADCQHGFRKKRSCVTQLIQVMDEFTEMIDRGENIDVIYLDFRKAFDSVPHERLLQKLLGYGICGEIQSWVRAFLSDRKQCVRVGNDISAKADVLSGIPQGSILGPVLFTIFINDLPDTLSSSCKIFADDTKIYGPTEKGDVMQEDVFKLQEWSNEWNLYFNVSKCKVMHIGRTNEERVYKMRQDNTERIIDPCSEEKDLGVTFDSNLTFDIHINKAIGKANQMVGLIRRTFSYLTKDTFLKLYKALIRPHLEYGNNVWHPRFIRQSAAVERVQRRATKLLRECEGLTYPQRLAYLGLHSLKGRRVRGDLIDIYKLFNDGYDLRVDDFFRLSEYDKTRNSDRKIYVERWNLRLRKFTFRYRNINLWNNLPNTAKYATTTNSFKNQLDGLQIFSKILVDFDE